MLKTNIAAAEKYRNALRPAILDSVREVLNFYGVESAAQIYLNGENETAKLIGTDADSGLRGDLYTDGVFRNKVFVVAETQQHDFNSVQTNNRTTITEQPVWHHTPTKTMLVPVFESRVVNVELNSHFTSRAAADQFVDRINYQRSQQMVDFNFSATIHLPVNHGIVAFFEHLHTLLTDTGGTVDDLGTWFGKFCRTPFTMITNVAGKEPLLAVPMKLNNIGIQFQEPRVRLAQKGEILGKYEVGFAYSFYYQVFSGWDLEYPLEVNQKEIDAIYIPAIRPNHSQYFDQRVAPETAMGRQISSNNQQIQTPYYLRLPAHDQWAPPFRRWMTPLIQARVEVQNLPQQLLFNLNDLNGEVQWQPDMIRYIKRRYAKAFSHHDTPFLFTVWSGDLPVLPEQLEMDENQNITFYRHPTMENTHHFVLNFDYAIQDYSQDFWDDLKQHPEDWSILPPLFPWYPWDQWDEKDKCGNVINPQFPPSWVPHLPDIIKDIDMGDGNGQGKDFNRYENILDIIAYRRS